MNRARRSRPTRAAAALVVVLLAVAGIGACSSSGSDAKGDSTKGELVGLFRLTPGAATGGHLTGTWFRMLQPGADPAHGPYMINADSPADGGQATLLSPGRSGGLRTAGYQTEPTPAFDPGGHSLADGITTPTAFFGVNFSISTNPVDPQTKAKVGPPTVIAKDGKLTADLSSWAASWNNQEFNQGAPKPVSNTGAKAPGQEKAERVWDWVAGKYLEAAPKEGTTGAKATGTYDAKTGAFVLQWTSFIEGGPFNGFTGLWHLEGVFEPGRRAPA
jgi:hypothetical protein